MPLQHFIYPWVHLHGIKLFAELKVKLLIFQFYQKHCHPKVQVQNIHRSSHSPFTSVLWSVLHWNDPEFSMKSKHGQQYQPATVWTRGDRAAKPSSQLGAQINRQDRHSVCVYSSLWLCLCGIKALFEQVRIVDDCMRSIMNEDILRGPGSSIMMYTSSHQPCLSHPCLCIFKSTYSIIRNSPFSSKKTIPPLQRKTPLIYEMPMLLCQLVRVQVLQEAALQDVTCAVHIFCLIVTFPLPRLMSLTPGALSLLDRQSYLALLPLFSLHAVNLQPNISTAENSNFT